MKFIITVLSIAAGIFIFLYFWKKLTGESLQTTIAKRQLAAQT